jgi:hypothetical protein
VPKTIINNRQPVIPDPRALPRCHCLGSIVVDPGGLFVVVTFLPGASAHGGHPSTRVKAARENDRCAERIEQRTLTDRQEPCRSRHDTHIAAIVSRSANPMGLIILVIVLMLLFGGGGFYYGGPYLGGGVGTVLLIVLIVLLVR